jgi:hypothetical protein
VRQGYWGFAHNRKSRMEDTGFRVLLSPTEDTLKRSAGKGGVAVLRRVEGAWPAQPERDR